MEDADENNQKENLKIKLRCLCEKDPAMNRKVRIFWLNEIGGFKVGSRELEQFGVITSLELENIKEEVKSRLNGCEKYPDNL